MELNQVSKPKNRPWPQMPERSDGRRALELALFYLSRQAQTVKQIRDKLSKKEFEPREIENVISRLQELHLLDDFKYAQDFIRSAKRGKPKGKHRIRLELIKKGVDKELVNQALEEGFNENEQEQLISQAAKSYLKKCHALPKEKVYNRLMGHLLRRGFDYDKVSKHVKEVLKDF